MKRRLVLFACALLFIAAPLAAEPWESCPKSFQALPIEKRKEFPFFRILTREDRQRLADIARSGDPTSAFQKVLDEYMRIRLEKVPPESRARTEKLLNELLVGSIRFNEKGEFVASGRGVDLPEDLKNTALTLSILAHEMEHLIKTSHEASSFPSMAMATINTLYNPSYIWRSEYGAMRAEWEILHALPEEWVEASKDAVEQSALSPKLKRVLLNSLDHAGLGRKAYLRQQFEIGRYSGKNAIEIASYRLVSSVTLVLLVRMVGDAWRDRPRDQRKICLYLSPDNPFYSPLCEKKGSASPK